MMSNAKAVIMALLLAYRARAVPVAGASPEAEIQAVIDALKGQMQSLNPVATTIVDNVEAELRTNGVLSPEHIAALNTKLHMLSPTPGTLNATSIAEMAIRILEDSGAFETSEPASIESKTVVLSTEMINEVLARGSIGIQDCPDHRPICCVIL